MKPASPPSTDAYGTMQRFEGRNVLITGASRGIGRAIALRLAREGANVGVNYLGNREAADAVCAEIHAMGRQAAPLQGDVRDDASVRAMVDAAVTAFGRVHVLVNNAGVEYEEPIDQIDMAHWEETFAVNVKGLFFCARAVAEHMQAVHAEGDAPSVVCNITSRFGFLGDPGSLPYGASKAAAVNLTKAMAKLWAPTIRVVGVAPAYTATDMMAQVTQDYIDKFNRDCPMKRVTTPEDTAAAVAFMASDDASYTTGQNLLVDGGYSLK